MMSVREICRRIQAMERDLRLFEVDVHGVRIWPLVRMKVYYRIAQKIEVFSTPHSERIPLRNKLAAVRNVLCSPFTSPLHRRGTKRYLVFDHPRKVKVDGEFADIYTRELLNRLPPDDTEVFENWTGGVHLTPAEPGRSRLDDLSVKAALATTVPVRFSTADRQFIAAIEARIRADFGIDEPLCRFFAREIRHHRACLRYYMQLLAARRPEKIFLVVSYGHYKRALLCAAKQLGIETVELQHGTFSPYHLGYNFDGVTAAVSCFPDTFWSFGDYWNDLVPMPIPRERIVTAGFAHFHRQKKVAAGIEQTPGSILFISQGVIGKQLSAVVRALAERLPDHPVAVRLHPGEWNLWKTDYPDLVAASLLPNVTIHDRGEANLYAQFASSHHVVGVFSTAIYEGLALGCTTFVLDLPGAEYMDYLVERKMVFKVPDAAAIAAHIAQGHTPAAMNPDAVFALPDFDALLRIPH